jgi:hypothetical protein
MKIKFEKRFWFEAKAKLLTMYSILDDIDFQYKPGEEWKVPERIREIIRMPAQEFYKLIASSKIKIEIA